MASWTDLKPLVVGIDARLRSGESGGVEQFIIGLASGLSRLTDGPERYVFLCEDGDADWLRPHLGGPCELAFPLGGRPRPPGPMARLRHRAVTVAPWLRGARFRFRRLVGWTLSPLASSDGTLEAAGAQVIHFPMQSAFLTERPSIYQPWDLQHLHLPDFFTPEVIAIREQAYRTFCARAERVVVATRWAKRDLAERYGLDPQKIAVVPVPPPFSAYPAVAESALTSPWRRSLPERFLLYPAQTWKHKNHLRLLQALALLRDERGIEISLVCSGARNDHFRAISREIRRLRLDRQVRFVGFVSAEELQVLYRTSRALIFPSLFEGWGLPVVEAFSAGLPVACARVTSLPDLVGDAALLFDPNQVTDMAEAIRRIWTDEPLRRHLAQAGRARVRDLDWTHTGRVFRALYRNLAHRTRSGDLELLAAADTVLFSG